MNRENKVFPSILLLTLTLTVLQSSHFFSACPTSSPLSFLFLYFQFNFPLLSSLTKVVDSFPVCLSSSFNSAPLLSHSFLLPSATDKEKMSLSLRQLVLMVGLVSMLTAFITGQTDGYHTQIHRCGRIHTYINTHAGMKHQMRPIKMTDAGFAQLIGDSKLSDFSVQFKIHVLINNGILTIV